MIKISATGSFATKITIYFNKIQKWRVEPTNTMTSKIKESMHCFVATHPSNKKWGGTLVRGKKNKWEKKDKEY